MPWRLFEFIIVLVMFFLFIIFNLENKCDISFGFITIKDTPVFLTVFSSFIAGTLCALLFVLFFRTRKKEKVIRNEEKNEKKPEKKFGKQSKKSGEKPNNTDIPDNKQYGID